MMKRFLKSSLLAIALIATVTAQSGTSMGQEDFFGNVFNIQQAPDGTTAAYYDPYSGEVIVSNGGNVSLISVFFADSGFGGFGTFDEFTELGLPNEVTPNSFSYLSTVSLPVGIFNLGAILPIFDASEYPFVFDPPVSGPFSSVSAAAIFRADIAKGGDSGIFFQERGTPGAAAQIQVIRGVPEPGSMSLLALAGLGLVARRRRG